MSEVPALLLTILVPVALITAMELVLTWRERRAAGGRSAPQPAPAPRPGSASERPDGSVRPQLAGNSPADTPMPTPGAPAFDPAAAEPGAVEEPTYLEREPELSEELGSGGQGRIHSIANDPEYVFKQLALPVTTPSEEFQRFVALQRTMEHLLSAADVDLVWPRRTVVEDGAVQGYVMPRFPEGYTLTVNGIDKEASLMYAVPKDGPFAASVAPTAAERLALVVAVGHFLAALHRLDYVYGDVSWGNILFRLHPRPTVLVFDVDGVRRVGARPALSQRAADTVDWNDPALHPGVDAGFDSDRYKFALLAYRLLISLSVSAALPPGRVDVPADRGITADQAAALRRLWLRAGAGGGRRPTIAEWLVVLDRDGGA